MIKPRSPVIVQGNNLAKGLLFSLPMFEGGGKTIETVLKSAFSLTAGATWIKSIFARSISFNGTAGSVSGTTTSNLAATAQFSFSIWVSKGSFTGVYKDMIWLGGTYDSDHNFVFQHDQSGTMELDVRWSGTNGRWYIPIPSDANYHNYTVTYDSIATTSNPIFYKDGVQQAITQRQTPTGSRQVATTKTVTIGSNFGATDEFWLGDMALILIWGRILSPQEAKSLYTNPWQLYTNATSQSFAKGF